MKWVAVTSLISGIPGLLLGDWYIVFPSLMISGLITGCLVQPFFVTNCLTEESGKWVKLKSAFGMCLSAVSAMPIFLVLLVLATPVFGTDKHFDDLDFLSENLVRGIGLVIYAASILTGIVIYPVALISGAFLQIRWSRKHAEPSQVDAEIFS